METAHAFARVSSNLATRSAIWDHPRNGHQFRRLSTFPRPGKRRRGKQNCSRRGGGPSGAATGRRRMVESRWRARKTQEM
jgi:hypothetical protein